MPKINDQKLVSELRGEAEFEDVGNKETAALMRKAADRIESLVRGQLSIGNTLHNTLVAMQSAHIEWRHGRGAESAMEWIENTLMGPGLIPDEDDEHGKNAQAFCDANYML